jgi:hypothetical protein
MKIYNTIFILVGLALSINSYADHDRSDSHFEARYESYHGGNDYNPHHHKHHYYRNDLDDDYHDNRERYYVRHVHTRDCGHHYQPAFNTRVKVFLGI